MARRPGIAHRVIETSLDILEEDETRRRIAWVLASPELRAAIEAICESAAGGALDALDEERTARLTALGVEASPVLTAVAVEQVAPAVARVAAEALSDALAPLREPERQQEIERWVEHVSRRSGAAIAAGVREELGPLLHDAVREQITPALRSALADTGLRSTLAALAQESARAATVGMNDGLEQLGQLRREQRPLVEAGLMHDPRPPLVRSLDRVADRSSRLAQWLSVGVAIVAVGALVYVVSPRQRGRAARDQNQ